MPHMITRTRYLLLLLWLARPLVVGCTAPSGASQAVDEGEPPSDNVEVVYFHRTQRCSSCIYVEEGTRYTLETYFKDEMAEGKVTFEVLNVEDKENAAVVEKYDAYSSSLFINAIKDGTDHIEEVVDVWVLVGEDEAFVKEVKNRIEESLKRS